MMVPNYCWEGHSGCPSDAYRFSLMSSGRSCRQGPAGSGMKGSCNVTVNSHRWGFIPAHLSFKPQPLSQLSTGWLCLEPTASYTPSTLLTLPRRRLGKGTRVPELGLHFLNLRPHNSAPTQLQSLKAGPTSTLCCLCPLHTGLCLPHTGLYPTTH